MENIENILELLIKLGPESAQFIIIMGAFSLVALSLIVILKLSNKQKNE